MLLECRSPGGKAKDKSDSEICHLDDILIHGPQKDGHKRDTECGVL